MCDCLKNIRNKLIKDTGDEDLRMDTAIMLNMKTGEKKITAGRMEIWYRKKNRDGMLAKKETKSFLSFSHCPFCGDEY